MPFYTKNNKTIFFSHIPKTGGSSVDLLFQQAKYNKTFYGGDKKISFQHRHSLDEDLINEKNNYNIIYEFTVFRNPLERLLSEFFMRSHNHLNKTSEDFHNFTIDILNTYELDKFINDNHIRPQVEFISENMDIFKFNEWDKLVEKLKVYDDEFSDKFPHINHATDYKNTLYFSSEILGWRPKKETEEIVKEFYKEDYKIYKGLK